MKMNLRKLSRRGILGILALSLSVTSVFALALFTQSFAPQTISNPAGLNAICTSLTDSVSNNGTSGNEELFTLDYSCGGGALTSTSQSVLSVATTGNYKPAFAIDTSGSTATIVSTSLSLLGNSIQGNALFCNSGAPSYSLTSGTPVALTSSLTCQNGSTSAPVNLYYYELDIVVSSHGTISVAGFSITWVDA
jgi:hypothetical protein